MTPLPSTILLASLLQAAAPGRPIASTEPVCPEIDHIELSQSSMLSAREICVSPGILTGIIFDLPVEVEFQEELRFMSILQGRSEISFRPPQDLAPGEQLRLTAKLGKGETRQAITFLLVARPGRATHQVEVYHDSRPRESLLQDVAEEHAKNQRLQEESQQLLAEIEQAHRACRRLKGLTGAYLSGALYEDGIQTMHLPMSPLNPLLIGVFAARATSYRTTGRVALEVFIHNSSPEKWAAIGSSLLDAEGNNVDGLVLSAAEAIAPNEDRAVFVEVTTPLKQHQESYTLKLFEDGPRTVTVPQVVFPP